VKYRGGIEKQRPWGVVVTGQVEGSNRKKKALAVAAKKETGSAGASKKRGRIYHDSIEEARRGGGGREGGGRAGKYYGFYMARANRRLIADATGKEFDRWGRISRRKFKNRQDWVPSEAHDCRE